VIGQRLLRARKAAGPSLRELAERTCVSHTAISKFEKGLLTPSSGQWLCRLFKERGWRKHEPGALYPPEETILFKQLVFHALGEDLVDESKAAELLGRPSC
jgi:transcriptional regulator with XRE-family HTH domain